MGNVQNCDSHINVASSQTDVSNIRVVCNIHVIYGGKLRVCTFHGLCFDRREHRALLQHEVQSAPVTIVLYWVSIKERVNGARC
jgi:hypothetical protein